MMQRLRAEIEELIEELMIGRHRAFSQRITGLGDDHAKAVDGGAQLEITEWEFALFHGVAVRIASTSRASDEAMIRTACITIPGSAKR
jgi:hypothetical protein